MKVRNLSVFFPFFNEEGSIEIIVKKALEVLEKLHIEYEIILVNDGSTDNTKNAIDKIVRVNRKVRAIHHPKNLGYGEALKSGFYGAKYDTIVYTDGDNQFDFEEVHKFLEKIDEYDLIVGYRIKRQDPFFRILFKMGWKLSLLAFFRLTLKDADCGFKMIKRKVLETIPHLESQRGAMINAELVIKTKKAGFKIGEVGVDHYPRISGKPTGASLNVIVKSYMDLVKLWWSLKDQKSLFLAILGILILAAILRFYRISEYMTFLGDEGRDAIIVREMLINFNLPFIGPPTSVGNIYLGPLYYYMMAVPMAIFWLNPVAAAGMNALIGVLTVFLVYYLGKIWFGRLSGLIASFLYAISPVTIAYSKTSWNPNPAPFFSLLSILTFYKAHQTKNFLWLGLTGAFLAAAIQMHYLALILIPIIFVLLIKELITASPKPRTFSVGDVGEARFQDSADMDGEAIESLNIRKPRTESPRKLIGTEKIKNVWKGIVLGVTSFLVLMLPLFFFDLKHDFMNYNAIIKLLTEDSAVKGNIFLNLFRIPQIFIHDLIGRHMGGENLYLSLILSVVIILGLFRKSWPIFYLGVWLIIGLLGLSFYQGNIYDHYLNFLNPVPFLLIGSLVTFGRKEYKDLIRWGVIVLVLVLIIFNFQKNPLSKPPQNQLKRTQDIAKFVIEKAESKPFNFALIAKNNYDSAYQFYLEEFGSKPARLPLEKTAQLLVVCEDLVCDPTHNSKFELTAFGWSKIEWEQEYNGVKVFKLVANPSGKP